MFLFPCFSFLSFSLWIQKDGCCEVELIKGLGVGWIRLGQGGGVSTHD